MCTNNCEMNCFCHMKTRPCDPHHCQCKDESCRNPIKRVDKGASATVSDENNKIEDEVKVGRDWCVYIAILVYTV